MTTPDHELTAAFVAAFQTSREARQRYSRLSALLARKLSTSKHSAHTIACFVEVAAACGYLQAAFKPWVEVDGVSWRALVFAASGQEPIEQSNVSWNAADVFGHILRELRALKGVESAVLAGRAEIDARRFDDIDRGFSEPNLVELFNIATALEISPSDLMRRLEEQLHGAVP